MDAGNSVLKKIYLALWMLCGLFWLGAAINFYFGTYLYFCRTSACNVARTVQAYLGIPCLVLMTLLTFALVVRRIKYKAVKTPEWCLALITWIMFLYSASFVSSS